MEERKARQTEPIISNYMHRKGNRLGIPVSGSFELTPRCNFDCKMCYVHMTEPEIAKSGRKELSADQWLGIASDALDEGMFFLLLTGGEPLIRKDFEKIYLELKKMGLMVSINSNGSMLEGERGDFLLNNPPTRLNITLYGGSDETYERLCGRPVFHKVIENIRKLKEAGVAIRLNVSVTPDNCGDIEKIYQIAKELKLHAKSTTYMFPSIRLGENIPGHSRGRFEPKEAAEYMLKCQEQYMPIEQLKMIADNPLLECAECIEEERQGIRCRAGRSTFWITWDGKMMPCGMMNDHGQPVLEMGFKKSWEITRQKAGMIKLPIACTGCEYRDICNICAASCYAETGGYENKPEYICQFVKEMKTITKRKYGTEDIN